MGLWWNNMDLSIESFSAHHVHALVLDKTKKLECDWDLWMAGNDKQALNFASS